jgi:hypothetical protein
MGGEISLRSQHHHGSTFAFTIALRMWIEVVPDAAPRWSDRATKSPGQGGYTVLVVDDNSVNRAVARAMLERDGFVVQVAHDGVQRSKSGGLSR